ncbi:S-adenosyl-L-methionine-dependent methyltransferase [Aspergillus varians]
MSDLTESNRQHFDKVASNHENDFGELINNVISELKSRRKWISPKLADTDASAGQGEVRLLDYACGAGTVSKALAPYVTQTIGLDLSAKMIDEYNKAARELALTPEQMQGYQFDLLSEAASPAGNSTNGTPALPPGVTGPFDIIVTGMALHHVADPSKLLTKFNALLKPGGVCITIDMVPGSAGPVDDAGGSDVASALEPHQRGVFATIGKHGFTEGEMREVYEGAGMGRGFEYVIFERPFRFTMFGRGFVSTGFISRGERGV